MNPAVVSRRSPSSSPSRLQQALLSGVSFLVTVIPLVAAFLVVGSVFLYGRQPLESAADYSPAVRYATAAEVSEYGAVPRFRGGWDLVYVDSQYRIAFTEVAGSGKRILNQVFAQGADASSTPTMAESRGRILVSWVQEHNGALTLEAAYAGSHRSPPFRLNTGGLVEHPQVVPVPGGGFDVLFEWQHPDNFDIFLASIPPGATHAASIRRLVRSPDYGFYPRGIVDGRGNLDVLYLERCCKQRYWTVDFRQFDAAGHPLDKPKTLSVIGVLGTSLPEQWGITLAHGPHGSVWGAWYADGGIAIAHWDAAGRTIVRPTLLWGGEFDIRMPALAMAPVGGGGVLYYTYPGQIGTLLGNVRFNSQGQVSGHEPVASDVGGSVSNPRAGALSGKPEVIWQKEERDYSIGLEGSVYRPGHAPSLAARFGLDAGGAVGWTLVLLVFGALFAGVLLAAANMPTLAILLVAWLPVSRLVPRLLRWPVYLAIIAFVLVELFIIQPSPPFWVFILPAFGRSYGELVVAGALFVSFWTGWRLLRNQEPVFRAAAMSFAAVYFIAAMAVALIIQGELGQV